MTSRKKLATTVVLLVAQAGAASSQAPFAPAQSITTTVDLVRSTFAIDLDNDGDADVLSASEQDDKIAWYENRLDEPAADFGPQRVISTSADGAWSVFAADLDGDGDADALSASALDDKIAWYENRLDEFRADFGPQQVISTSADGATSVFAIDLDNDGDADVLSASKDDDKIAWYENRLDEVTGDFSSQKLISTSADGAASVYAVDLDNDGDADVLSASEGDNKIGLYENNGSGGFGGRPPISTSVSQASAVFATDLDRDGDADVLAVSFGTGTVSWIETLGKSSEFGFRFGPEREIHTGGGTSIIAIDLDGDGDDDVVSAAGSPGSIDWSENRLIHRSAKGASGDSFTTPSTRRIAAGDVDRDGDLDIFLAHALGLELYRNRQPRFLDDWDQSTIATNVFADLVALDPADLDRDGDLDLLAAGAAFSTGLFWYENTTGDGSGNWTKTTFSTTSANDVRAVDVDGDGDLDALFASGPASQIGWHENRLNEPSGDFGPAQIISTAADSPRSVFAADLDRDGDPDVLSASSGDDKIAWYENIGDGAFQPQQIVITTAADGAWSVFAADIDGDGDLDALSASANDDTVAWYANDGTGVFSGPVEITSTADGARWVSAADVDHDGDLDVLTASRGDGAEWFENTNSGGTAWTRLDIRSDATRQAIVVDLTKDGQPDWVWAGEDKWGLRTNRGVQFTTRAERTAQGVVSNGQLEDVLAIEVSHLGRAGDTDVELVSVEIRLEDLDRVPLASAQANALIATLRLYRDDGSGVFEESTDFLVSTLSTLTLDNGYQTIPVVDDDPNAAVAFGSPATFFVTFEMTANAQEQPVAALWVTHNGSLEAEDRSAGFPLSGGRLTAYTQARVHTALTDSSCWAPFDLNLVNRTIDTTLTCEAGTDLRFGSSMVTASGVLTLRAGSSIELEEGGEVDGQLVIEIDSALLPW